MSVKMNEEFDGRVLVVRVSGKLTRNDYRHFMPQMERLIEQFGRIRLLFHMNHDFHGWKTSALWEDVKFGSKHFNDIERLAIVGEKTWEKWMTTFCRPFTTATVRYFDRSEADEAHRWIEEDLPVKTS